MNFANYERSGWADYGAFAQTVAAILQAAIETDGRVRLQQVRSRAKEAKSLRRKLEAKGREQKRDLFAIDTLEDEIKDLAGARVVVYTDTDAERFIQSDPALGHVRSRRSCSGKGPIATKGIAVMLIGPPKLVHADHYCDRQL